MEDKVQELYQSNTVSNTIFDQIKKYADQKYRIRFNLISLDYEINLIGQNHWESLNINSLLIELNKNGINANYPKLEILIKSNLIERYNPIKEYFIELSKYDQKNKKKKKRDLTTYFNVFYNSSLQLNFYLGNRFYPLFNRK